MWDPMVAQMAGRNTDVKWLDAIRSMATRPPDSARCRRLHVAALYVQCLCGSWQSRRSTLVCCGVHLLHGRTPHVGPQSFALHRMTCLLLLLPLLLSACLPMPSWLGVFIL